MPGGRHRRQLLVLLGSQEQRQPAAKGVAPRLLSARSVGAPGLHLCHPCQPTAHGGDETILQVTHRVGCCEVRLLPGPAPEAARGRLTALEEADDVRCEVCGTPAERACELSRQLLHGGSPYPMPHALVCLR